MIQTEERCKELRKRDRFIDMGSCMRKKMSTNTIVEERSSANDPGRSHGSFRQQRRKQTFHRR